MSEQNAVEDKQKDDNETEMWIPADSESESEEIERLGSDFEEEKVVENEQDDDYSFDALDTEETVLGKSIKLLTLDTLYLYLLYVYM